MFLSILSLLMSGASFHLVLYYDKLLKQFFHCLYFNVIVGEKNNKKTEYEFLGSLLLVTLEKVCHVSYAQGYDSMLKTLMCGA